MGFCLSLSMEFNLERFIEAQETAYLQALSEIKNGRKTSHWMWFIFPQLKALGSTETALFYGISGIAEATAYLQHPILRKRLIEISEALLAIGRKSAHDIFGKPDDRKLRSCMTLFGKTQNTDPVFGKVLVKYYDGQQDKRTIELLET
jgi:uncharacterized protein (DUF1810 family)